MLIYNSNKEFIGIDEKDLRTLGFANLAQLKAESEDFADLFMRTTGYIHNFQHVHWIDYVECADAAQESRVVIKVNGASFEASLDIDIIYLSNHPSSRAYMVHLNHLRHLGGVAPVMPPLEHAKEPPSNVQPKNTKQAPTIEKKTPLPTLMETTPLTDNLPLDIDFNDDVFVTPSPESVKDPVPQIEEEEAYDDDGYVFDPQVASEQLGLPIDLIEEFIQDFIAQAQEFKGELYESLHNEDISNVATLSHKLKGVAANLRIENALNVLTVINEAKDFNVIESNLKHFYRIIAILSGEEVAVAKKSSESVKQAAVLDNHDDDEFVLDFKNESEFTSEPETETETEEEDDFLLDVRDEVIEVEDVPRKILMPEIEDEHEPEEDDLLLDFRDDLKSVEDEVIEIQDEDVPSKILMPELEDDDFITPEMIEEELKEKPEKLLEEEQVVEETEIIVNYPKDMIANSIGLDMETFEEVLEDYIVDTNALSLDIHNALAKDDLKACTKSAIIIKGMSESIHMKAFETQIESLIKADDKQEMISAIKIVDQVIKQISKKV